MSIFRLQARPPAQGTQAAIFVPWAEIREARPARLSWRAAGLGRGRSALAGGEEGFARAAA